MESLEPKGKTSAFSNSVNIADFYDRSRAFAEIVGAAGGSSLHIVLRIAPEVASHANAQLLAAAICDILPRISERYINLDLCVPDCAVVLPRADSKSSLSEYLLRRLSEVCPWGNFRPSSNGSKHYDFCLSIGPGSCPADRTIWSWNERWCCFVNETGHPSSADPADRNPLSSLATAAIACMLLYARAESVAPLTLATKVHGWSLFDYCESAGDSGPSLPKQLRVGRIFQAGLGGTGNALLWALRFGPDLIGSWTAFEHEHIDPSNFRYLLMKGSDPGISKSEVIRREFGFCHSGLNFRAIPEPAEHGYHVVSDRDVILATVDDPGTRVQLQRLLPNSIFSVGTASQCLSLSRHALEDIENGEACLECLYEAGQRPERRHREATVSFVLALLGALLGAELLKTLAWPHARIRNAWLGMVFNPAIARPYAPLKSRTCRTCTIIEAKSLGPMRPIPEPGR